VLLPTFLNTKIVEPTCVLNPGDSVFLPLYGPHRVINDDVPCISWNVGFNTRKSLRRKKIHLVNLELRKLGLPSHLTAAITPRILSSIVPTLGSRKETSCRD